MKHADKLTHFGAGALLALVVAILFGSGLLALAGALFAGIAKEVWDVQHADKHTGSWWDVAATAAPGVLVWVLIDPGAFAGFA